MGESLPGRPSAVRSAVLRTATRVGERTIPQIPDGVKRLLLRRRSVTVDGNTLDTTLQLTLLAQRAMGINGLVMSEDVDVARSKLREATAFHVHIPVDGVASLSISGAVGPLAARHYRPTASSAPLLVFYHGGGFVMGDLDTHDGVCRLICRDAGIHVLSVDYRLAPEHKAPAAAEDAFAA